MVDVFSRPLWGPRIDFTCNKLGAYDLYALAWGES